MHAAPLHGRRGPEGAHRPPQARVAIEDAQQRRLEPPRPEVVQAAFPRLERLAAAKSIIMMAFFFTMPTSMINPRNP
jgi:hypothetical protein